MDNLSGGEKAWAQNLDHENIICGAKWALQTDYCRPSSNFRSSRVSTLPIFRSRWGRRCPRQYQHRQSCRLYPRAQRKSPGKFSSSKTLTESHFSASLFRSKRNFTPRQTALSGSTLSRVELEFRVKERSEKYTLDVQLFHVYWVLSIFGSLNTSPDNWLAIPRFRREHNRIEPTF